MTETTKGDVVLVQLCRGMVDAEAALAAELQESRRRAEELQALLDAERRRAAEAETKLKEREVLLREAQRKPVDKELADKQRAVLSQVYIEI